MRQLIVTEFVTLDGVMEEPTPWQAGHVSPEIGQFKFDELFACGALLLGRVTYEEFVAYWPAAAGTGAFGERMNELPKFVATTAPGPLTWNAAPLEGDVITAVQRLKQQQGGDLLTYGSAALVQTLLRAGLVDELRLMVYPTVLGRGKRLFSDTDRLAMTLRAARPLGAGVVLLTYRPEANQAHQP
ncbi:dihydrofolate reductase family protein [Deinococcus multiflagellatus]|uniref:Dihydrofolate reductase family protein n=1 Tax=Deinococcus multiflagellatus TaxID=1656887 RepID=A0ABW1ZEN4_9DEIO|nr:dihydrofolate reductase family protein [Deinococcus multiflagellatus]MBZ9712973.1 dihydrofolate reductase family protein [Deinococcus multiflagellatus]